MEARAAKQCVLHTSLHTVQAYPVRLEANKTVPTRTGTVQWCSLQLEASVEDENEKTLIKPTGSIPCSEKPISGCSHTVFQQHWI